MRALILALFLTGCSTASVRPTIGECSMPDPSLAMMGQAPESLHEMVKSACAMVGIKVIPTPRYDSGN